MMMTPPMPPLNNVGVPHGSTDDDASTITVSMCCKYEFINDKGIITNITS